MKVYAIRKKISLCPHVASSDLCCCFSWSYLTWFYDFFYFFVLFYAWQENCSLPLTVRHKLTEQNKIKQWSNSKVNVIKLKSHQTLDLSRQRLYSITLSRLSFSAEDLLKQIEFIAFYILSACFLCFPHMVS